MDVNNDNLHDTAALRSLSEGIDFDGVGSSTLADMAEAEEETYEFLQAAADGKPAEIVEVETETSESRIELAEIEDQIQREQKKLQAIAVAKINAAAKALHFRKVALPFLFGMAVVLGAIAFATYHLASTSDPTAVQDNPLLANSIIFVVICLMMAVIMLAGCGYFAYEMARLKSFIRDAQENAMGSTQGDR